MEHFCTAPSRDRRLFARDARATMIAIATAAGTRERLMLSAFLRCHRELTKTFARNFVIDSMSVHRASVHAQHLVSMRLRGRSICEITLIFRLLV
jgi:hypothetical protein